MKRRKRKPKLKPADLIELFESTCGWCRRTIPPDTEVFGGGIKARRGVDLTAQAGTVMPLQLVSEDMTVLVAVTALDSDAKRDGYDFMYMVCSEACGELLKAAFQVDIDLGNVMRSEE